MLLFLGGVVLYVCSLFMWLFWSLVIGWFWVRLLMWVGGSLLLNVVSAV